jgi:hypothetical protein
MSIGRSVVMAMLAERALLLLLVGLLSLLLAGAVRGCGSRLPDAVGVAVVVCAAEASVALAGTPAAAPDCCGKCASVAAQKKGWRGTAQHGTAQQDMASLAGRDN